MNGQNGSPSDEIRTLIQLQRDQLNELRSMRYDMGNNNKVMANSTYPFDRKPASFTPYSTYSLDSNMPGPYSPQTSAYFQYAGSQMGFGSASQNPNDGVKKGGGFISSIFEEEFARSTMMTPLEKEQARMNRQYRFQNAGMSALAGTAGLGSDLAIGALMPGLAGAAVGTVGGAAVGAYISNSLDQTKEEQQLNKYFLNNSYRFINSRESTSALGTGFNARERQEASSFIRTINSEKFLKDTEVTQMLQGFTEYDLLKTSHDVDSFKERVSKLIDTTKSAALTLGTTYENIQKAMGDLMKNGTMSEAGFSSTAGLAKYTAALTGKDAYGVLSSATSTAQGNVAGTSANLGNETKDNMYAASYYQDVGDTLGYSNPVGKNLKNYMANNGGAAGLANAVTDTFRSGIASSATSKGLMSYLMSVDSTGNLTADKTKFAQLNAANGDPAKLKAVVASLMSQGTSADVVSAVNNPSTLAKGLLDLRADDETSIMSYLAAQFGGNETMSMFGITANTDPAILNAFQARMGMIDGISALDTQLVTGMDFQANALSRTSDAASKKASPLQKINAFFEKFTDAAAYTPDFKGEKITGPYTGAGVSYDYSNVGLKSSASGYADSLRQYYSGNLLGGTQDILKGLEYSDFYLKDTSIGSGAYAQDQLNYRGIMAADYKSAMESYAGYVKNGTPLTGSAASRGLGETIDLLKKYQAEAAKAADINGIKSGKDITTVLQASGISNDIISQFIEAQAGGSISEDLVTKITSGLKTTDPSYIRVRGLFADQTFSKGIGEAKDALGRTIDLHRSTLPAVYGAIGNLGSEFSEFELGGYKNLKDVIKKNKIGTGGLLGSISGFFGLSSDKLENLTAEQQSLLEKRDIEDLYNSLKNKNIMSDVSLTKISKSGAFGGDLSGYDANKDGIWADGEIKNMAEAMLALADQMKTSVGDTKNGVSKDGTATADDVDAALSERTKSYQGLLEVVTSETKAAQAAVKELGGGNSYDWKVSPLSNLTNSLFK